MINFELDSLIYGNNKSVITLLGDNTKYNKVLINNMRGNEITIDLLQNLKKMMKSESSIMIILNKEDVVKINSIFDVILPEFNNKYMFNLEKEKFLMVFSSNKVNDIVQFETLLKEKNKFQADTKLTTLFRICNDIDLGTLDSLVKFFLLEEEKVMFMNFKQSDILDSIFEQKSKLMFTYVTEDRNEFSNVKFFCKKNNKKINYIELEKTSQ